MAYTPTTWTTGDTITASALNKIEQGIAGAGGATPFVITASDSGGGFTTDKTFNQVKTAFNTGAPVFIDFTSCNDWEGKYLVLGYRDSALDIIFVNNTGYMTAWADSADGNLYWVD